jgi:hypothetical protein
MQVGSAMNTNTASAIILTPTSTAFSVALSRVPNDSTPATTAMMKIAGTLRMPPSSGLSVSASGKPNAPRSSGAAYPDQPTATVDTTREYSRISDQPITHAINSPSTT